MTNIAPSLGSTSDFNGGLCSPAFFDRHGPAYRVVDVDRMCAFMATNASNYFTKRAKTMTLDMKKATEVVDEALLTFSDRFEKFLVKEADFKDRTKVVSGSLRDAMTKMSDGLARIEKTANFDRLERYAELLERVARALAALAVLDEQGKLEKIAAALK